MKTKSRFVERLSWFLDESITLPGAIKSDWTVLLV